MKDKLFKFKKNGTTYLCLGIINHKNPITRVWETHVLYEGEEKDIKYSRTLADFESNFEEIKI